MGMQLIETIEVGSGGAASIEFTGIPQDGVDLVCVVSGRLSEAYADATLFRFNNDTGSNYSKVELNQNGTSVQTSIGAGFPYFPAGASANSSFTANTFGSLSMTIANYTSANNKSISVEHSTENNATFSFNYLIAGQWANPAALTSIKIYPQSLTSLLQYSTASLYKITAD